MEVLEFQAQSLAPSSIMVGVEVEAHGMDGLAMAVSEEEAKGQVVPAVILGTQELGLPTQEEEEEAVAGQVFGCSSLIVSRDGVVQGS